jgi:glycosyltransferase involved in cell wall biosynthesis
VRVLTVNKFYYHRGGAETVMFDEMRMLRDHGHDTVPFAMRHASNYSTPYSRYFVSNIELREASGGIGGRAAAAGRILWSREASSKVTELVRNSSPDIAHAHNVYHQLSPSILRALSRAGVPVVMTLHDYKLVCPAYTLYANDAICERCSGGKFYNAVLQGCVKGSRGKSALCAVEGYAHRVTGAYARNVKLYVAPSRFLASKVVELGLDPRRIVHVPNSVETRDVPVASSDGGYVLFTGRLERVKGVRTLLEAFRGIAGARGVQLRIAGDGEDRAWLEDYCREHALNDVHFLGHLAHERVAEEIDGAAFVVVPSEWYENAPLSVLEAAARGKAVVVSGLGGLPELVIPGETGVVFEAGNASALREAIEQLLADPAATREMGRKGRAFMEETFSPERHYEQLMGVYARALSAGNEMTNAQRAT